MNKVLIKTINNVSKEGVSFTLTHPAALWEDGLVTKDWYVSWDRIGMALFGDAYADAATVTEMQEKRNETI
jgi:hypothetical protein